MHMRAATTMLVIIGIGVGLDLLSFIGWSAPSFEASIAVMILVVVAVGTIIDIRWGIAAVLLELLWGSHGHLLHLSFAGVDWSLRMGIFAVMLAATVWHLRDGAARRRVARAIRAHPAFWSALAFSVTLVIAAILGALRHPWDRVFFDANAWAFLALSPAFVLGALAKKPPATVFDTPQAMQNAKCKMQNGEPESFIIHHSSFIILAGALYLILRTYALLFLFTHDLGGVWAPLYQWVRDTRLGEVTVFPGGFPRVFLPSAVLLFPALLIAAQRMVTSEDGWLRIPRALSTLVFGGSIAVLILGLSRSYWFAFVVLGAIVTVWLFRLCWRSRHSPIRTNRRMVRVGVRAASSVVVMLLIAVAVVRVPFPRLLTSAGFGETLAARFRQDAAVGNRWQQITPLFWAIRSHPFFGNGFGAAVTYETRDPRTLATHPSGRYTTTAFEWGYLDDILERGLIGLLAELWLLGALVWFGLRRRGESAALALGLLAIAVVHTTSPYLNHPLGIGMLMLVAAAVARRDALPDGVPSRM